MIDQLSAPYAALLLRWSLGVMFMAHALLKWRVCVDVDTVAVRFIIYRATALIMQPATASKPLKLSHSLFAFVSVVARPAPRDDPREPRPIGTMAGLLPTPPRELGERSHEHVQT